MEHIALKVLFLEDSVPDMELLVEQLSEAGYQLNLTHADNEASFKEALQKKKYDIILSDFKLPGFDAFNALKICKKLCPEIPFICVSGSIGEEAAVELLRKGAVDYVMKDQPGRLPYTVKRALDEAKERMAHRKAEIDLIESENRFRQVAETVQEWIWEVDTKGMYTYASPVVKSLLGYTPDELVGKKYFYDFFVPDQREKFKKMAFKLFSRKEIAINFENTNVHKNGNLVILSTSGSPVFDDDGNFSGYRGVDNDITERKKAEELLKLSEEKFRNLFYNHSAIKLIIEQENGNIVEANEAAANFYGFTTETLQKMNISQINVLPAESLNNKIDNIETLKNNYSEFRHRKADGSLVDVEVFSSSIRIGDKEYLHSIIHDISEKKKAEDTLQLLNRAIESSSVSVIITDEKGDIIYTNPFFTQITGYSQEEAIGKNPKIINSGWHSKEFYQELWNTLYEGNNWEGEFRNKKKNGELFWEKAIISPVLNSYGVITNFIAIKEDISYQKQAEETRQQLEVAQRTARFRQDFLAKMSHEIRTPLTGVLGMIEVLEQTKLSEKQSDFVSTIKASGENLSEIINQVLDFSKIEAGKISLHPVEFEFKTLLENTKVLYKDNLNAAVELVVEIDPRIPPFIRADKFRLSQVVNNLVSNAIKFTHKGLVVLKANLGKAGNTDEQIVIKVDVCDTGIGIAESLQEKLFNPFVQSEDGEKSVYEGTGLGLSICKELVELMQGEIGVKSKKGEGSTFWFSFPADKAEEILPPQKQIIIRKSSKKLRVLLAEDTLVLQKTTKLLLNSMGHEVQMANNGQHALEIFKPGLFDLILMDINMPIMDGITTTRLLKEEYTNMPPVVGLSANAFEGDSEKYIAMGMDDYLTKPFNYEKIMSLIMKYFG
jgi:PAS domain S-box-containing protein